MSIKLKRFVFFLKIVKSITLVKNDRIISEDVEVANTFRHFFDTAVQSLNLTFDEDLLCDTSHLSNPIDVAIGKFKNHPSIIAINSNVSPSSQFLFSNVEIENMLEEVNCLDVKKTGKLWSYICKMLKDGFRGMLCISYKSGCKQYLLK